MTTTKKPTTRPLTMRQTIELLRYVADSPPKASGGFDEAAVETAAAALHHIRRLQAELRAERRLRHTADPLVLDLEHCHHDAPRRQRKNHPCE